MGRKYLQTPQCGWQGVSRCPVPDSVCYIKEPYCLLCLSQSKAVQCGVQVSLGSWEENWVSEVHFRGCKVADEERRGEERRGEERRQGVMG